jgi:hypothetical protein
MVEVLGKGVTSLIFTTLKMEEADTRLHGTISKAFKMLIYNALMCQKPFSHRHSSAGKTHILSLFM